jgi:hypothetical protein
MDQLDLLSGGWGAQKPCRFHLLMQRNGIEIETIWPGRYPIIEKYPGEKIRFAQRFDHVATSGDQIREILLTLRAVRKSKFKPISPARLDPYNVNELEHRLLGNHSSGHEDVRRESV